MPAGDETTPPLPLPLVVTVSTKRVVGLQVRVTAWVIGSMVAFPRTRAEREKSGDPRLSIEERYEDEQEYLGKIEAAARELAKQRFLLEADVPQVIARAKQRWEQLAAH